MAPRTAPNIHLLKAVRTMMNDPIYSSFRTIYLNSGRDAALTYLTQYFNREAWPNVLARLFEPTAEQRVAIGDDPDDLKTTSLPTTRSCPPLRAHRA